MKITRNSILIFIGIIILLAVCLLFFSRRHCRQDRFMMPPHPIEEDIINNESIEHMRRFLDLTDEQLKKIKEIDVRYDKAQRPFREKLESMRDQVRNIMENDTFEEAKARHVFENIDKNRLEIRILNIKEKFEIDNLLTLLQKEKLHKHIKKAGVRFKQKFHGERPEGMGSFHDRPDFD